MLRTKGFSLLELMIVISIIGILAMIAIPSYQHYAKRARFAEVISSVQLYKTAVMLALQQGINPKEIKNGEGGIPPEPSPTNNLESIQVKNAIITATASDRINKATYILTPDVERGTWKISGSCLSLELCGD